MTKPGIYRAVPMAIIGFALGALLTLGIRALQSLDPVWDPGVALVVTPFTTLWLFLWGMGAFNPKMSEHAAHPPAVDEETGAIVPAEEHAEEEEEDAKPTTILGSEIWRVAFYTSLVIALLFFVAAFTDLHLQTVGDPEASVAASDTTTTFALPFGMGEFQASQLTVFIGFIAFTMISLFAAAGLIYLFVYGLNYGVTEVREHEPTVQQRTPPRPVRALGRLLKRIARGLRNGIPAFFGYRN